MELEAHISPGDDGRRKKGLKRTAAAAEHLAPYSRYLNRVKDGGVGRPRQHPQAPPPGVGQWRFCLAPPNAQRLRQPTVVACTKVAPSWRTAGSAGCHYVVLWIANALLHFLTRFSLAPRRHCRGQWPTHSRAGGIVPTVLNRLFDLGFVQNLACVITDNQKLHHPSIASW